MKSHNTHANALGTEARIKVPADIFRNPVSALRYMMELDNFIDKTVAEYDTELAQLETEMNGFAAMMRREHEPEVRACYRIADKTYDKIQGMRHEALVQQDDLHGKIVSFANRMLGGTAHENTD